MAEILKQFLYEFWSTLSEMSPYLLFGFFVAGLLSVFISTNIIERHLSGRGIWPLLKASLFGIPLPLCSCGVIPVTMSLHKHGASKGASVAFLLSTPQTGADSILVTYSLLGPIYAIFRPLAALVTGLVGGTAVTLAQPGQAELQHEQCHDVCCNPEDKRSKIIKLLDHGFVTLPRDIGKAMFAGLIIAAVITVAVPGEDSLAPYLGGGLLSMILMMFLGIPVYVCATASVPMALALIEKGVSPGTALVFLMTGPATNAAAFMTIWSGLGKRTAIIYICTVAATALAAGMIFDMIVRNYAGDISFEPHLMLPVWFKNISAVVLIIVLLFGIFNSAKHSKTKE